MKLIRPLWHAGALLSAQQFQQQARWEDHRADQVAHLHRVHPWGVRAVAFDPVALRLGKLKATCLQLRLPDGTEVDSVRTDELPDAWDLTGLDEAADNIVFVLALPLEQGNGANCLFEGVSSHRPKRYRQVWRDVPDWHGEGSEQIGAYELGLSLRRLSDDNADYFVCPVVRLQRDGQGEWSFDASYVPPLLEFAAHGPLLEQLGNVLEQVSAKRERLMAMRREANARMADYAVADVSLFWLLHIVNTAQPVLEDLIAYPNRHPEQVYQALIPIVGGLLTFSLEHDVHSIPRYQHQQLETVFPVLMDSIGELLEASLPSQVVALELVDNGDGYWHSGRFEPRLCEPQGADFYLSVRSPLPMAELQERFPRLAKAGGPSFVRQLVKSAVAGVPLKPLQHVPAAIPLRLQNQYFALDMSHPQGLALLSEGACSFYVSGALTDIKLELYAVLRS